MKKVTIYTDGGSRGNPGPAGAGWVIVDEKSKKLKRNSKYLGTQTNNWAEYESVALALKELKRILGAARLRDVSVEIRLDSELVARQLRHEYQVKEGSLLPQFIKIHNMRIKDFPKVEVTHVKREQNKEADALANEAMDSGTQELL
jgi:ribonuclease HI